MIIDILVYRTESSHVMRTPKIFSCPAFLRSNFLHIIYHRASTCVLIRIVPKAKTINTLLSLFIYQSLLSLSNLTITLCYYYINCRKPMQINILCIILMLHLH